MVTPQPKVGAIPDDSSPNRGDACGHPSVFRRPCMPCRGYRARAPAPFGRHSPCWAAVAMRRSELLIGLFLAGLACRDGGGGSAGDAGAAADSGARDGSLAPEDALALQQSLGTVRLHLTIA